MCETRASIKVTTTEPDSNRSLAKILIVEDGQSMRELLQQALTESGYAVSVSGNGFEGLRQAPGHDLIIADLMMPVMNGFDMVRKLREQGVLTPVIVLTAKDNPKDLVRAFDLGADDYLVKPFRLEELLVRVKALLRRIRQSVEILRFDHIWMDVKNRRAKAGDRCLSLSNTEFDLLKLLLIRQGETISKVCLLEAVWQDVTHGENLVEVYINYLRNKLEAHGEPRVIHTVRGHGYVMERRDPEQ